MFLFSPNRALAAFLSINLISTFCTQFHLFALNFKFLHCLGLIAVLSANELAEIFACVLLNVELTQLFKQKIEAVVNIVCADICEAF